MILLTNDQKRWILITLFGEFFLQLGNLIWRLITLRLGYSRIFLLIIVFHRVTEIRISLDIASSVDSVDSKRSKTICFWIRSSALLERPVGEVYVWPVLIVGTATKINNNLKIRLIHLWRFKKKLYLFLPLSTNRFLEISFNNSDFKSLSLQFSSKCAEQTYFFDFDENPATSRLHRYWTKF